MMSIRGPHVDDPGTIGRDPRIAGDFEFEHVRRAEVVRVQLLPGKRTGGGEDGERERGGRHPEGDRGADDPVAS